MAESIPQTMTMFVTVKITVKVDNPNDYRDRLDMEEQLSNVEAEMDYNFSYDQDGIKIVDTTIIDSSYSI